MPIQVSAIHMDISEEVRERVVQKAQHVRRIFDGVMTVHVTLEAIKERRAAEIVANVSHGSPVVARVLAESLNEAIDRAFDKVEAQLRKHKDKLRDHRVREQEIAGPSSPTPEASPEGAEPGPATE